jgi:archaellin
VRPVSLLVVLTAIAALGITGTASADFTNTVNGTTLTVTSSAGNDTINITAASGVITVHDVPTTLAANRGALIVVNTGDGDDIVDAETLGVDD